MIDPAWSRPRDVPSTWPTPVGRRAAANHRLGRVGRCGTGSTRSTSWPTERASSRARRRVSACCRRRAALPGSAERPDRRRRPARRFDERQSGRAVVRARRCACVDDGRPGRRAGRQPGDGRAVHGDRAARGVTTTVRGSRSSRCETLGDAIVGVSGLPTDHFGWRQFRALGAVGARHLRCRAWCARRVRRLQHRRARRVGLRRRDAASVAGSRGRDRRCARSRPDRARPRGPAHAGRRVQPVSCSTLCSWNAD